MQLKCTGCQKTLQVADEHAGKKVKCPCGTLLLVPTPSTSRPGVAGSRPAPSATTTQPNVIPPASRPPASGSVHRPHPAQAPVGPPQGQANPTRNALGVAASAAARPATTSRQASAGGFDTEEIAGLFNQLSDAELKAPATALPKAAASIHTGLAAGQLASSTSQHGEYQQETRAQASKHLFQSLGILIFLGVLRVAINGYLYSNISNEVESLVLIEPDAAEDVEWLVTALKIVYGMFIAIGVGFLVCAGLAFQFPMTATITALVLYVISELVGFVTAPWTLLSIRGWIVKAAIFGGLVQAINNAAYYKFVKSGGRD